MTLPCETRLWKKACPGGQAFWFVQLGFQVDAGLLVEDVADMACEVEGNGVAVCQSSDFCAGHVHGGNDHNNMLTQSGNVQVDGGTHHFGNVDLAGDAGLSQLKVLGTDAQNDLLLLNVVSSQLSLLVLGQLDGQADTYM